MASFNSVILDVDSTLAGIEGIDWLAGRRNAQVAREVARLTAAAMTGQRLLNEVYSARLGVVRPSAAEVAELARAYSDSAAPGAADAIARIQRAGITVEVITSGIWEAVTPFTEGLGIHAERVHAVRLEFDEQGNYAGFDTASPLVVHGGKRIVAEALRLPEPVLAVGDGITDAEIRPVATAFAAFTAFARRESVVAIADHVVGSFAELEQLVLGEEQRA